MKPRNNVAGDGPRSLRAVLVGLAASSVLALALAGCGSVAPGPAPSSAATPAGTAGPTWSTPAVPTTTSMPTAPAASSAPATSSTPTGSGGATGTAGGLLRPGAHGARVLALQQRLSALGYWLATPDGSYGDLTAQAVTALQKVARLGRDGVAGPRTLAALDRGVRPQPRSTSGHVIEVDLTHQVLLVVDGGRVTRILNTSTGSGVYYTAPDGHLAHATTPTGTFSTSWQVDAWHTSDLGRLYRPKFFHPRGIAVHGATSVPSYPASHGCVRVSVPAMDMIWSEGLMPIGSTVRVY